MSAKAIAAALGAKRAGACWMAQCPAHEDRKPSLSLAEAPDGKVVVYCHAGCDQNSVIGALKARGLWSATGTFFQTRRPKRNHGDNLGGDQERLKQAMRIWNSAAAAPGTLVETYLRSRGIQLSLPSRLRFNPALRHPGGETWPAMVALVTRGSDNAPIGVHRTFLARDGVGKAPVDPSKMMLGLCGGGAVRLAPAESTLLVGEGIETCLSAMQATGIPTWAALSTSGLRILELPTTIVKITVLADGDEAGEEAARSCAWRWRCEGREVRIARPPEGMDFNDMLTSGYRAAKEKAA
jgi:hypothetical protein